MNLNWGFKQIYMILEVVCATQAIARKAWADEDSNPDLSDVGAVLNHSSYLANWELVAIWVNDKPVDDEYRSIHIHDVNTRNIWIWTADWNDPCSFGSQSVFVFLHLSIVTTVEYGLTANKQHYHTNWNPRDKGSKLYLTVNCRTNHFQIFNFEFELNKKLAE